MELNRRALRKVKGSSLSEAVFTLLREAICQGSIGGKERLVESEIAQRLGISRTPIREAIKKLENEGLVTLRHNKGAQVNPISADDLEEIYHLVAVLEGMAAFWAFKKINKEDIRKFGEINKVLREKEYREDPQKYVDKDREFHSVYLNRCGNKRLMKIVQKELKAIHRYRILSHSIPKRLEESVNQHEEIIEAFMSRKAQLVRTKVENHIFHGGQLLKSHLEKYGHP